MPYFEVDGESIYSKLSDAKFHSLRFHDGMQPADDAAGVQTLPLYPNIASIFGSEESFTVVLRPDNYIGMLYKGTDLGRADEYMRDRIGRPL